MPTLTMKIDKIMLWVLFGTVLVLWGCWQYLHYEKKYKAGYFDKFEMDKISYINFKQFAIAKVIIGIIFIIYGISEITAPEMIEFHFNK